MFLIVVWAKAIGVVVKLANTGRSAAIKRREYCFVPYRAMAPKDARSHELGLVALNQWRKFVEAAYCRARARDDIEVSDSKAGCTGLTLIGCRS